MSETLDPLIFLRAYLQAKKPITIANKILDFGGSYKLPVETPTAWERGDKRGYYSLGTLYLQV